MAMAPITGTAMDIDPQLALLTLFSPAFPVGGHAYSHGLEQEIAEGGLRDDAGIGNWIGALIERGSAWNDAVLFSRCYEEDIGELNELALALAGSAERLRETVELGGGFSRAFAAWSGRHKAQGDLAYPVAAGAACAALGIDRRAALAAFLLNVCANLVSVAVRLVPLGQSRGLAVQRALAARIDAVAARAAEATLADLGGNCLGAEIAAMRHETLEPRIFRS
jgi:urease accessory protein